MHPAGFIRCQALTVVTCGSEVVRQSAEGRHRLPARLCIGEFADDMELADLDRRSGLFITRKEQSV